MKFKVGDIVVCIDNKLWSGGTYTIYPLTINKQYKVLYKVLQTSTHIDSNGHESTDAWLLVQCDDESQQHFSKSRFIALREYNLNKLKI